MREFGAIDAKNQFAHLLDLVEQEQEVSIMRLGREVARLVPGRPAVDREAAQFAMQRLRERAEQCKLGRFDWSEWKAYRDEGRR